MYSSAIKTNPGTAVIDASHAHMTHSDVKLKADSQRRSPISPDSMYPHLHVSLSPCLNPETNPTVRRIETQCRIYEQNQNMTHEPFTYLQS
jgi:hypothetical protein